jgi:hypothetical protein
MTQRLKERLRGSGDSVTEPIEEVEYRPTPPKNSFMMHVSLHMTGRGRPMPFTPNDIDLE